VRDDGREDAVLDFRMTLEAIPEDLHGKEWELMQLSKLAMAEECELLVGIPQVDDEVHDEK